MSVTSSRPPLVVSSRDFARLEQLLDAPTLQNDAAARALMEELTRANVVAPEEVPQDVVTMNSTVSCIDERSDTEHELTLCYPGEADVSSGRVSILAPIGSALLGLSVGQRIEWQRAGGRSLQLRVAGLRYQPEAAGDMYR